MHEMSSMDPPWLQSHIQKRCAELILDPRPLAELFVAKLMGLPEYQQSVVDAAELQIASEHSIILTLHTIAGTEPPAAALAIPAQIGHRRADQGIRVDALIQAITFDFELIWDELLKGIDVVTSQTARSLGIRVWQAIESLTNQIVSAYHERESENLRFDERVRDAEFKRLIDGSAGPAGIAARLASKLGFDSNRPFTVVAHAQDDPALGQVRRWEKRVKVLRTDVGGECAVTVLQVSESSTLDIADSDLPCFFEVNVEIEQVPRVAALLRRFFADLSPSLRKPANPRDAWIDFSGFRLGTWSDDCADIASPLLALPEQRRKVLLEVIDSYAETGSVGVTASELFSHRNTILSRITTIENLTGLRFRRPKDFALLLVSLASANSAKVQPGA